MKIIQHSCIEGDAIDLRQAEAVARHKPDCIIFESPNDLKDCGWTGDQEPLKRRFIRVAERKRMLRRVAKEYPWVLSQAYVLDAVVHLWKQGKNVELYDVDAPSALLRETIKNGWNRIQNPRRRGVHFPWWVYIYLRERIMANTIAKILEKHTTHEYVVLMAMQKFHWLHVRFLLDCPPKEKIFALYFGAFPGTTTANVSEKVESLGNQTLTEYWRSVSDFQ